MRVGIRVTDRVTVASRAARIDTGVFLAACNCGCIGANKQFDDIAIEHALVGFLSKDSEGNLIGCRFLVRPVGGREGVVDIADGHDARLQWYLAGHQAIGIAGAIEFLVMAPRDLRNPRELIGPGNHLQEVMRVHHVRFDFLALA